MSDARKVSSRWASASWSRPYAAALKVGGESPAAQGQERQLIGLVELQEVEPARGQNGSLPEPLVSRPGADLLGPCRVGDRLVRAAQEQERQGSSRQRLVGVLRLHVRLQECAAVDVGTLGLALSQLEEGAAQAGGRVAKVFGEQGVVFLTSTLDRARLGVHIGQIEPGGRTVRARAGPSAIRLLYSRRARAKSPSSW